MTNPEQLFEEKKGLVFHAVKQQFGSFDRADAIARKNNMELHDLFQIGQLVLWNLCLKYDPAKEESFNGYIIQSVKWKITSEFYTKGLPIKFNTWVKPGKRNSFEFHSIDSHVDDDSDTSSGYFAVSDAQTEQNVINKIVIHEAMSKLSEEEKFVLIKRSLGFSDDEIGRLIGKGRRQTTRIKNRAYKKLNPDFQPDNHKIVAVGSRTRIAK